MPASERVRSYMLYAKPTRRHFVEACTLTIQHGKQIYLTSNQMFLTPRTFRWYMRCLPQSLEKRVGPSSIVEFLYCTSHVLYVVVLYRAPVRTSNSDQSSFPSTETISLIAPLSTPPLGVPNSSHLLGSTPDNRTALESVDSAFRREGGLERR